MSENAAEVYAAAMALPLEERTKLTRMLVESVGDSLELLYADEWAEEIKRRLDECERGEAEVVTFEEAMASIRTSLENARR
jgi:putative addiction module component (TIGR02574 family)